MEDILRFLESWGVIESIFPFLFLALFFYVILLVISVFRNKALFNVKRDIYLSLIFGFLVVLPHLFGFYPAVYDIVDICNRMVGGGNILSLFIFPFVTLQKGVIFTFWGSIVRPYWNKKQGIRIKEMVEFSHKRFWGIYTLCVLGVDVIFSLIIFSSKTLIMDSLKISSLIIPAIMFLLILVTGIYMVKK